MVRKVGYHLQQQQFQRTCRFKGRFTNLFQKGSCVSQSREGRNYIGGYNISFCTIESLLISPLVNISSNALTQRWGIIPGADRRVSGGKEILHKCARIKSSQIGSNFTIIRKRGFHQCQNIHGNRVLFNETEGKGYKTPGVCLRQQKNSRSHHALRDHDNCRVPTRGVK